MSDAVKAVVGWVLGVIPLSAGAPSEARAQPANNVCELAFPAGLGGTVGNNGSATTDHTVTCAPSSRDVWYRFVAASTAVYTFSTVGSPLEDTVLALFSACGGDELACDDDGGGALWSSITFPMNAGESVLVRVASYGVPAAGGGFVLTISAPGACCLSGGACLNTTAADCGAIGGAYAGDGTDCAAIVCAGYGACCRPNGTCFKATSEGCGECSGGLGGGSAKYTFIPNADCGGRYGTECPKALSCCLPSGTCVELDQSPCAASGGTSFNGTCGATICPPAGGGLDNNACAGARVLVGQVDTVARTAGATPDLSGSGCGVLDDRDVWFSFTPWAGGSYRIELGRAGTAPPLDTTLAVYNSCGGTRLACNDDDAYGVLSSLSIDLAAGSAYKIRVAGNNHATGAFVMHVYRVDTGACCEPSGACYSTAQFLCPSPWIFLGTGSVCSAEVCPCPVAGAPCCLEAASCAGHPAVLMERGCAFGDAPTPGTQLATQQNTAGFVYCSGGRGFKGAAVNQPFCHTFSGLPSDVATAALEILVRANPDTSCNDSISLQATGNPAAPFAWGRRIGTTTTLDCGSTVVGLLSSLWAPGSLELLCLDLNALPNADGGTTNLMPLVRSGSRLDVYVQDDTSVDWVRLWYTRSCCPADVNHSGQLSVQDLFDFLMAFFSGEPLADFNQSGGVGVQDLFDFLEAFFLGCP